MSGLSVSPSGGARIPNPIPVIIAIPANFTQGSVIGGVTAIDPYTARIQMSPPLQIPDGMVGHVINADISYTQPNMGAAAAKVPGFAAGNNRISITWNGGARVDLFVPAGLYSYIDLAQALNQLAVTAGWIANINTPLFTLQGIVATQKILFGVNPASLSGGVFPASGVVIDLLNPSVGALNDSMGPILGFPTTGGGATLTIAGGGATALYFLAPNVSNFAIYTGYILNMSWCADSSVNGVNGKALYLFGLGGRLSNQVANYEPPLASVVPIVAGTYTSLDIYFTDQSGNRLAWSNFQAPTSFTMIVGRKHADGSAY